MDLGVGGAGGLSWHSLRQRCDRPACSAPPREPRTGAAEALRTTVTPTPREEKGAMALKPRWLGSEASSHLPFHPLRPCRPLRTAGFSGQELRWTLGPRCRASRALSPGGRCASMLLLPGMTRVPPARLWPGPTGRYRLRGQFSAGASPCPGTCRGEDTNEQLLLGLGTAGTLLRSQHPAWPRRVATRPCVCPPTPQLASGHPLRSQRRSPRRGRKVGRRGRRDGGWRALGRLVASGVSSGSPGTSHVILTLC